MEKEKENKHTLESFLDYCDNWGLNYYMKEIEKTKFIGEDGKEYFRFPTKKEIK